MFHSDGCVCVGGGGGSKSLKLLLRGEGGGGAIKALIITIGKTLMIKGGGGVYNECGI